jgi:hypothetical protein
MVVYLMGDSTLVPKTMAAKKARLKLEYAVLVAPAQ